jgi:hypothetical protein
VSLVVAKRLTDYLENIKSNVLKSIQSVFYSSSQPSLIHSLFLFLFSSESLEARRALEALQKEVDLRQGAIGTFLLFLDGTAVTAAQTCGKKESGSFQRMREQSAARQ